SPKRDWAFLVLRAVVSPLPLLWYTRERPRAPCPGFLSTVFRPFCKGPSRVSTATVTAPKSNVSRATLETSRVLQAELKARINGEVRFDRTSRMLYSTDASNYQIEPVGVVIPRSMDDA